MIPELDWPEDPLPMPDVDWSPARVTKSSAGVVADRAPVSGKGGSTTMPKSVASPA